MALYERGRVWPWDVWLGYAAAGTFVLRTGLSVVIWPHMLAMLSACLVVPLVFATALIVAARFVIGPHRRVRALPLALVSGCAGTLVAYPGLVDDLHLIARVYRAGGPGAVNDWGQELIREHRGKAEPRFVERDQFPAGVRDHLSGATSVGGTLWSDLPRVRIELGGGFYHYGVVVYPTGYGPPAQWWQRAVDWPPEVVIYHEE